MRSIARTLPNRSEGATGTDLNAPKGYQDWPLVFTTGGDSSGLEDPDILPVECTNSGFFDHEISCAYWLNASNPIGSQAATIAFPCPYYTWSVGYSAADGRVMTNIKASNFVQPVALIVAADGVYMGRQSGAVWNGQLPDWVSAPRGWGRGDELGVCGWACAGDWDGGVSAGERRGECLQPRAGVELWALQRVCESVLEFAVGGTCRWPHSGGAGARPRVRPASEMERRAEPTLPSLREGFQRPLVGFARGASRHRRLPIGRPAGEDPHPHDQPRHRTRLGGSSW